VPEKRREGHLFLGTVGHIRCENVPLGYTANNAGWNLMHLGGVNHISQATLYVIKDHFEWLAGFESLT